MGIKRWVRRWIFDDDNANTTMAISSSTSIRDSEFDTPIRFTVTPARGGVVVCCRNYDRQKDRSFEVIHVIHDDEDIAQKIGHIVSMELMKS